METKALKFDLKDFSDDAGTFTGHGNVFGVKDSYDDIMLPGCFARTLQHWREAKGPMPMLFQHDTYQPVGFIEATEDLKGLAVKGTYLLDIPKAREAYTLTKARVLHKLSIGWSPVEWLYNKTTDTREVKEARLWEVSPVLWAANEASEIEQVKGIDRLFHSLSSIKDGTAITNKHREMAAKAISALQALLAAPKGDGPATEEPGGSGEPTHPPETRGHSCLAELAATQKRIIESMR